MRHFLLVPLALTAFACGPMNTAADGADAGASPAATATDAPASPDAGPPVPAFPFQVSNLPADAPLAATGDWVFNRTTCSRAEVTIDTTTGKVSCSGQDANAFTFSTVTQSDPTYGDLTQALFVTRRLVIEPDMTVNVVGNRALVIVATDTVKIQGTLRASVDSVYQDRANGGGFGGVSKAKGGGPGGGAAAASGAGGGAYCGAGGAGGSGAATGKVYGDATIVPLLGGSAGGGTTTGIATGGAGGGAIQISAGSTIEISGIGVVDVAGGGGGNALGGAGGAGGAILLEAPAVSVIGTLAANGGGGSEGGLYHPGANGSPDANPARGGVGSYGSANGGSGSAADAVDGQPGTYGASSATTGASGGGGGAGRIRINATDATISASATISPSLATKCATKGTITLRR